MVPGWQGPGLLDGQQGFNFTQCGVGVGREPLFLSMRPLEISGPPWKNVVDKTMLLLFLLTVHVVVVYFYVTVSHTPLDGKERSYFTNIVVHNI